MAKHGLPPVGYPGQHRPGLREGRVVRHAQPQPAGREPVTHRFCGGPEPGQVTSPSRAVKLASQCTVSVKSRSGGVMLT